MMFKDEKEQNFFNYIANVIAEKIRKQLDEIEEQDGEVDFTQITLNAEKRCIDVNTDFIDADDGKRYLVHDDIIMYKGRLDFLPKIFYAWLDCYADEFEHGVNFSGWIYPHK